MSSNSINNIRVAVLPGDGIGKEITRGAMRVLKTTAGIFGRDIEFTQGDIGGAAIDRYGNPFPEETRDICSSSDAIFLGAVGGPKWDGVPSDIRPERGLLKLRKELGVYANLRPVKIYNSLRDKSPLKESIIGDSLDILIVRELTGGIYFGEKGREENSAYDILSYSQEEIERIAHKAFTAASKRSNKVTSVDKANVLESSKLWREVVERVAKDYPQVSYEHLYVDNAAMQLVVNPRQFDVILTSNMFGDILSDEASVITGSIGMLPSASIGSGLGLYEPIHGSAPDIAGKGIVNPIAAILSGAMMMRHSFHMEEGAAMIEEAVDNTLKNGYRTIDIHSEATEKIGTEEMISKIIDEIEKIGRR